MVPGAKEIVKYEALLVDDILGNYSKNARPVVSSKKPAKIKFAFQLNKLAELVSDCLHLCVPFKYCATEKVSQVSSLLFNQIG